MNRHSASTSATADGPVWVAQIFLLSLVLPYAFQIGPFLMLPHRFVLLIFLIPFFVQLFVLRRAGPVLLADWLLFLSALWAGLALFVNHPVSLAIEPFGIQLIEFFGAYLLARVSIRSAAGFRRMVWTLFALLMVLMPFATIESLTGRPILLDILPGNSVKAVDAGERLGMRRAQVVFTHPILFGVFASTGIGLFWLALRPRGLRFIGTPAAALATLFSLSTGALLSVVAQVVFITWERVTKAIKNRWKIFAILAVFGYILIDLLSNRSPFHVLVTYATFYQGSAYMRILIWQFGSENVWANPLFGLGLSDWARPSWMGPSVDNFWLLLAMRYGFPAIAMILAALFQILRRVSRATLTDAGDLQCRAAYLVVFGGIFLAGGTVHYWHSMMAFVMFIYGSGVWAATGGGVQSSNTLDETEKTTRLSSYTRQPATGEPIGVTARRAQQSATHAKNHSVRTMGKAQSRSER